jgi:hypothetical protein
MHPGLCLLQGLRLQAGLECCSDERHLGGGTIGDVVTIGLILAQGRVIAQQ